MSSCTIDLGLLTEGGKVRNLAGKERGIAAKNDLGLQELEIECDIVTIIYPTYITSITSSFFLGMFSDSVERLGSRMSFFDKFRFVRNLEGDELYSYMLADIEGGIDRCEFDRRKSFFSN